MLRTITAYRPHYHTLTYNAGSLELEDDGVFSLVGTAQSYAEVMRAKVQGSGKRVRVLVRPCENHCQMYAGN